MRRFFVILAIILTSKCFSYDEYLFYPQGEFTFKHDSSGAYYPSSFFFTGGIIYGVEKSKQKAIIGTVERLSEWIRAYVYKVEDIVLSTHRSFFLSQGTLFDSLKMYEIYDENNQLIGFIEGEWNSDAAACFRFCNEKYEVFAIASLDLSASKLTISTLDGKILITGEKTLNANWFTKNEYYWKIKKEDEQPFSAYFLWPFVGFLSQVWWR